jgi:hypothetical protein
MCFFIFLHEEKLGGGEWSGEVNDSKQHITFLPTAVGMIILKVNLSN